MLGGGQKKNHIKKKGYNERQVERERETCKEEGQKEKESELLKEIFKK